MTNLSDVLEEKRPFTGQVSRKMLLLDSNARPHVAKTTQNYIFTLGWELFPYAAYSPDMAPSDYHLYSGRFDIVWLIDISRDLTRYDNALMTLSLRSRWASIVMEFANYPKDSKRSLMQMETISMINIFLFIFLINVEFCKQELRTLLRT